MGGKFRRRILDGRELRRDTKQKPKKAHQKGTEVAQVDITREVIPQGGPGREKERSGSGSFAVKRSSD